MTTFILIAALMAACAAAAVAWPLLKERRTRWQGAVAGVVLIALAAVLYPRWSNWDWHNESGGAPAAARSPEVLAMVARLEERMRAQPNDLDGWLMLGRSYMTLERFEDASQAYVHALKLNDSSVEAMLGLGEALSMRAGGSIPPPAADLFERALTLSPQEPRALLYGGFAAAVRGDKALARARWEALKQLNPPPQIVAILDQRIAELGAAGPGEAAGAAPASASGGSGPAALTAQAAPGAAGGGEATINLSIAPALKSKLTGNPMLFVFAREPGASGPPLAVKRLTSAAIGTQVHLSAADSMVAGRALSRGQRISITARVSFSGQPLPAAGDLYGELTYEVGRDGARDLVIDRVAQ